jgi:hypothetical protein
MRTTENILEDVTAMVKERKTVQTGHMTADKACYNDPFLCQHMRGRVSVEENDIEWLDKLLAVLE